MGSPRTDDAIDATGRKEAQRGSTRIPQKTPPTSPHQCIRTPDPNTRTHRYLPAIPGATPGDFMAYAS